MDNLELYKKIAHKIEEKLGPNHISTIIQITDHITPDDLLKDLPQFLIIVKKFDKYTLMMITNILQEYPNELEIPYTVEYNDVQGMLDSIPKSFLEIKLNYQVLAGEDITEMMKPPSYEHFRAQTELTLRNDILTLRRDLIRVMSHQMSAGELLKEISIVALNSIRNYYQIVDPNLRTTEELISKFNEDFPSGKGALQQILEYTYQTIKGIEITQEDQLQLILSTFDNVLQPLLIETDALGIEFEKTLGKDSEKLSFEEFREKYHSEIERLQKVMTEEFERDAKKNEYVVRGELELKFRQREKELIIQYEEDLGALKNKYEEQIAELNNSFDERLEQQTEEFIAKKLEEQRQEMEEEYSEKIKKYKEELEFKYITTDLHDKEEKLRKEYNAYEKKLRNNFSEFEKELRRELEIKEQNYKNSLEEQFKARLEEEKDQMRKDFEEELDDALQRNLKNQQRRLEAEMKRREKSLEKSLNNDFKRREKEMIRQFKKELETKEKEVKTKLLLDFEREIGKRESKKSEDLMKIIEQEMALRYKEMAKVEVDLMRMLQMERSTIDLEKLKPQTSSTSTSSRSFMHPPESKDESEDNDLFSKILRDNRELKRGLGKKDMKNVS